jgi:uncharacterized membrane protein YtjA (UPF0391 family)
VGHSAAAGNSLWPRSEACRRAGSRKIVPAFIAFHRRFEQQRARNLSFRQQIISSMGGLVPRETAIRNHAMLGWVITFLVIALIAGLLGFGGIAGVSIEIAKVIFFIAVVLFLISAIVGLARRGRV